MPSSPAMNMRAVLGKRGTLQIDAAAEQHINWYREGVYPRSIATLETVLQSVRPAGIFQLLVRPPP